MSALWVETQPTGAVQQAWHSLDNNELGRQNSQKYTAGWAGASQGSMAHSWPGSTHQSSQPQKQGLLPHQIRGPSHALYTQCLAPAHLGQSLWPPRQPTGISLDLGAEMDPAPRLARLCPTVSLLHRPPRDASPHSIQLCLPSPSQSPGPHRVLSARKLCILWCQEPWSKQW